jgi:hypothetical protein
MPNGFPFPPLLTLMTAKCCHAMRMMAFITRYSLKRAANRAIKGQAAMQLALTLTLALAATGVATLSAPAFADAEVIEARVEATDDGHVLVARFKLELPPKLEEAVNKGVPLYFVAEAEVIRPRWYWLNEKSAMAQQTFRLSYNALTRQYRVGAFSGLVNGTPSGGLDQGFASLPEALRRLTSANLKLADKGVLRSGEEYQVWVRLRLDTAQLPKPFQVSAITNKDWSLSADWRKFGYSFTAPVTTATPASAPAPPPATTPAPAADPK